MKLAEALLEKKALNGRLQDLSTRFSSNAMIEEGEDPEESAEGLLLALQGAFDKWESLTVQINKTNNQVMVGEITMMEALAKRDILKSKVAHYKNLGDQLRSRNQSRRMYGETGPKMVLADNITTLQFTKLVDSVGQELRLLDVAIQAANWANDLVA